MKKAEGAWTAVVAEKPSVARDVAAVLGAAGRGQGCLRGGGYIVTWAVGHLVNLAQPHEIRPEWKHWRWDQLPMLPRQWPLVVYPETREQFDIVRAILADPAVERVVCATDAGREGELIFRFIYEAAACRKPVRRLWISSLTPEAIRRGFQDLKDWREYEPLADAARGRSRADWLVGMNLSRAYSLACDDELSVGRVQTPTLAMLVERELAIRAFVPEDYLEVEAQFSPRPGEFFAGTWFRSRPDGLVQGDSLEAAMRLPAGGEEAEAIAARARAGAAAIETLESRTERYPPPLLYDLTELQRHANRLWGFPAQRTLEAAQALYERHKLITYPRTDSRHLSADVALTLNRVVEAIAGPYSGMLAPETGSRPLGRRFVDDSKVSDHHAIVPTAASAASKALSPDEHRIYDLVCRRLLSAWHAEHATAVTTVVTAIRNPGLADRYRSTGTVVVEPGWKVLEIQPERRREDAPAVKALPAGLETGQPQTVLGVEVLRKRTRPPKRFTEATLLTAMETAGKTLDDRELSEAMKDCGLGTPATRAQIIETLLKRGYVERKAKNLEATDKGVSLIAAVHPEVKSPAMTGQWEAFLKRIERGQAALEPFLEGIERYVEEVVAKTRTNAAVPLRPPAPGPAPAPEPAISAAANVPLDELLRVRFGFTSFRPNQEAVCRAVAEGKDTLLVMPTGAGKSLCYQLPGIVRGGTTLVISPLIALMEDQVARLRQQGFAVERIHSGRDRAASRQTCQDYLNGRLEFLFIAPERLRVPGFPEMLARRKPSLIAVDEAHCISQWGHDFRPDYRRIGQHLPRLRPAPVIALTATATGIVQDDIVEQLGLDQGARFIHGFRRENIAIEVVEVPPSERFDLALEVLRDAARRPAIVYVPTRRQAEGLAGQIGAEFTAAAYHAGLDAARRREVQARFLEDRLEITVATIAFGMGIDKSDIRTVIHTALPGSLEAYYQEIGRAGRDGKPSRAILMQSYADRFTHDYFFTRDYPHEDVLGRIRARLGDTPVEKQALQQASGLDQDTFDRALEKLWVHGGAEIDFAENVSAGREPWRESYAAQLVQKQAQIETMLRFTDATQCRMEALVKHFGDLSDSGRPCGICDFCAPDGCVAQWFRDPTPKETELAAAVIAALRTGSSTTGRLHASVCGDGAMDRRSFELLLSAMARGRLVRIDDASFEKEGRRIEYRKVSLTGEGRSAGANPALVVVERRHTIGRPGRKRKAAAGKRRKSAPAAPPAAGAAPVPAADPSLAEALRQWRLQEARQRSVPAFRILTDRALQAIAERRPSSVRELLEIPGVGLSIVERYGAKIFRLLEST